MPLVVDKQFNIFAKAEVSTKRCPLISICPQQAISQTGFGLPRIDSDKCIECGKCVRHCGMKAIYRLEDKYGTIL